MSITVCTGFSPKGYEEYGKRFLETFEKYWPKEIGLNVYVEEPIPSDRARVVSLFECGGVGEFIERYKNDPNATGRKRNALWKERHKDAPYNFRFDAVKFCRQCFIPRHTARYLPDGDILVWLDADVVTFSTIPNRLIEDLLGDADISYLGRKNAHSEIGYWSVRLNSRTRSFLDAFAGIWENDDVFCLSEWHSAFVFDYVRKMTPGLRENNLTPTGSAHVWFQTRLGDYTDHCKGNRKALGFSPERNGK
jgi:hypothetical protein